MSECKHTPQLPSSPAPVRGSESLSVSSFLTFSDSQNAVVGCYVILFGAGKQPMIDMVPFSSPITTLEH